MTSETRRVAGLGLLGLEALIHGPDIGYYETIIKDSDGNVRREEITSCQTRR